MENAEHGSFLSGPVVFLAMLYLVRHMYCASIFPGEPGAETSCVMCVHFRDDVGDITGCSACTSRQVHVTDDVITRVRMAQPTTGQFRSQSLLSFCYVPSPNEGAYACSFCMELIVCGHSCWTWPMKRLLAIWISVHRKRNVGTLHYVPNQSPPQILKQTCLLPPSDRPWYL